MKKEKAQAEIIIIIVLLALVVVAGYLVYQSGLFQGITGPGTISEEQKTVKETVETFMLQGLNDVVRDVSSTGGKLKSDFYSMSDDDYATHINDNVIYWQKCSSPNPQPPDLNPNFMNSENSISENIAEELKRYIINNLDKELAFNKVVEFDVNSVTVNTNILDNRIDVNVNLPTTVEGQTFSQYALSFRTDFGKIYNFAKAFVNENRFNRHFEQIVFEAMRLSKIESEYFVPVWGKQVTEKSPFVVLPSLILANSVEVVARSALIDTQLWQPGGDPDFSILSLQGMTFPDFNAFPDTHAYQFPYKQKNINFYLAKQYKNDNSIFGPRNFKTTYDPVMIKSTPKMFMGMVLDTSNWVVPGSIVAFYSFTFPVVVSVKDSGMENNFFNFATLNYIDFGVENDMGIKILGDCGEEFAAGTQCWPPSEDKAKVTVLRKDTGGAIDGATVTISGCGLYNEESKEFRWETDSDGTIDGNLPSGFGITNEFKVEADGYQTHIESFVSNLNLDPLKGGKTVHLVKNPELTFKFYELFIEKKYADDETKCMSKYQYIIHDDNNNPKQIITDGDYNYYVFLKFINNEDGSEYYITNIEQTDEGERKILGIIKKNDIPAGQYDVELYTFKWSGTDDVITDDDVLTINSVTYTGDIAEVGLDRVVIDKSLPSQWSLTEDMTSSIMFRSRSCDNDGNCESWNFISRVIGVGGPFGNNEIFLEDNPADSEMNPGDEYQILNPRFDEYMHITDNVEIFRASLFAEQDYGVYVPRLEPTRNDPNAAFQTRLFNMMDYENQQTLITAVMDSDNCHFNILDTPDIKMNGNCNYGPEKEVCWVTPWQMRIQSGRNECGGTTKLGLPAGCSHFSCKVGDTYATDPSCFPSKCPGSWTC